MNFMQLVQRLQLECGVSGSSITTVIAQTGENKRLVTWINAAWLDIQNATDTWDWMRKSTSFNTVSGQSEYTLAQCNTSNFGKWDRDTFRVYNTAVGFNSEILMNYISYDDWRDGYHLGALRNTSTQPFVMSINPLKGICLGPVPNGDYTITGDYFNCPTDLALDTDIPSFPEKFMMAIVYRAMQFYGMYNMASEVVQRGDIEYKRLLRRMKNDQMEEITMGGSIA